MKKRIISIVLSLIVALMPLTIFAADSTELAADNEYLHRIEAGDFCGDSYGILELHECSLCGGDHTEPLSLLGTCPDCGGTLGEYCSGVLKHNPDSGNLSNNYHYVQCPIRTHADGCII